MLIDVERICLEFALRFLRSAFLRNAQQPCNAAKILPLCFILEAKTKCVAFVRLKRF